MIKYLLLILIISPNGTISWEKTTIIGNVLKCYEEGQAVEQLHPHSKVYTKCNRIYSI